MCQGHACNGCGSRMVYKHFSYGSCLNISNSPGLHETTCRRRTIQCCPLCNLGLWQLNMPAFLYGPEGEGWSEVTPGWSQRNPTSDPVGLLTPEQTLALRERIRQVGFGYHQDPNILNEPCRCQSCGY